MLRCRVLYRSNLIIIIFLYFKFYLLRYRSNFLGYEKKIVYHSLLCQYSVATVGCLYKRVREKLSLAELWSLCKYYIPRDHRGSAQQGLDPQAPERESFFECDFIGYNMLAKPYLPTYLLLLCSNIIFITTTTEYSHFPVPEWAKRDERTQYPV